MSHCRDCDICRPHLTRHLRRGTSVIIERDESRWPAAGSWRRYRGRHGTIVTVNIERPEGGGEPFHIEYGVAWAPGIDLKRAPADAWFLPHELGAEAPGGV